MKIEYTENGKLNINGLDIPIAPDRAASIYHCLFMLYMAAYSKELRLLEQNQSVIEEAENILRGDDNND